MADDALSQPETLHAVEEVVNVLALAFVVLVVVGQDALFLLLGPAASDAYRVPVLRHLPKQTLHSVRHILLDVSHDQIPPLE